MKVIKGRAFCDQPDRHEPRLKCGYPIPCPWHTLEVKLKPERQPKARSDAGRTHYIGDDCPGGHEPGKRVKRR